MTIPHWVDVVNLKYPQRQHQPPDDIAARFYPYLGPYSSTDPAVIEDHMKQLVEAGVGVLSISWYPPNTQDESALIFVDDFVPLIMDIAAKYNEKVCFHIEPYKDRTAASVRNNIVYIIDKYLFSFLLSFRYGSHPAFYRYQNKPLMYIYDSYHIPSSEWSTIFSPKGASTVPSLSHFHRRFATHATTSSPWVWWWRMVTVITWPMATSTASTRTSRRRNSCTVAPCLTGIR